MTSTSNGIITRRRHDLDNIRTFLTGLVVVHHTASCYGGPGGHPYQSVLFRTTSPLARSPLLCFHGFNQSFFMGLFFWISGRLSAHSIRRTDEDTSITRWDFVKGKLLRLGLPSLVYTLAIHPMVLMTAQPTLEKTKVKKLLLTYYSAINGATGPVWYTATLLLFDLVLAVLLPSPAELDRGARGNLSKASRVPKMPRWYDLSRRYGWIAVAGISFLVRLYYPGRMRLRFIALQPAFAPQYIFAYAMGVASLRQERTFTGPFSQASTTVHDTTRDNSDASSPCRSSGYNLLAASLVSLATLPLISLPRFLGLAGHPSQGVMVSSMLGGWNPYAFLYALWNEFSFVLVGPAVMAYFQEHSNAPATTTLFRPRLSYGAFLVHNLVAVAVERSIDTILVTGAKTWWTLSCCAIRSSSGMIAMTGITGSLTVIGSFALAKALVDRYPWVRMVI